MEHFNNSILSNTTFVCAKVLFFAKSKDLIGSNEANLLVPTSINGVDLKNLLLTKFPELVPIADNFVLAVDQRYVHGEDNLRMIEGIEVAIIPPLSGG